MAVELAVGMAVEMEKQLWEWHWGWQWRWIMQTPTAICIKRRSVTKERGQEGGDIRGERGKDSPEFIVVAGSFPKVLQRIKRGDDLMPNRCLEASDVP